MENEENATDRRLRIGSLFMEEDLLSEEQVQEILEVQRASRLRQSFGEIAVNLNLVSAVQRLRIAREHEMRVHLARFFKGARVIAGENMHSALTKMIEDGKSPERGLLGLGYYSQEEILETLLEQLFTFDADPDIFVINRRILHHIEKRILGSRIKVPVINRESKTTVITRGFLNLVAVDNLPELIGFEVTKAASPEDVEMLCIALYHSDKSRISRKRRYLSKQEYVVLGDVSLAEEREDLEVIDVVNTLFIEGVRLSASDLHIEPMDHKVRIRYRIDGILRHTTDLPYSVAPRLTSRVKVLCGLDLAEKRRHQDGKIRARIVGEEMDLRISTYASQFGENLVVRFLPRIAENTIDKIGLAPKTQDEYLEILESPSGIILITGPTGSGKTTTLYASLRHLNTLSQKIITIEDPIEYTIPGVIQAQINEVIGVDYLNSLKAILRQDPDVIVLGEIRDTQSAAAAVQAGLTGHKIFSTFHTDDTTSALLRLMDMGIDTFLISSTVVSVVAQRLVRANCPYCKTKYKPSRAILDRFKIQDFDSETRYFVKGKGCDYCNFTGFHGRTGIFELLRVNDSIRNAILRKTTSMGIRDIARRTMNLVSMREDGIYKALKGVTTPEEILRVVYHSESDEYSGRTVREIFESLEGRFNLPE